MPRHSQTDTTECIVDRSVNGRLVLRFRDGQELIIARRYLPRTAQEGDILKLHFHTEAMATQQKEELAKAILKELLNS